MHVGMAAIFQNPGQKISDREVYREELRLAELAEPLGYDSVWSRRASLHRLYDVPEPRAVPHLHGRPHQARAAGLDGAGVAVARSDPAGRGDRRPRSRLRRAHDSRHRPWRRARRVRGVPRADGREPRALRRSRRADPGRARDRVLRIHGPTLPAAAQGHSPETLQDVQGPHLCGGRVAGVGAHHGQARHRHAHHSAKAVEGSRQGDGGVPRRSSSRSTASPRRSRSARAGCFATRTWAAPRRWRRAISAATTRRCSITTNSTRTI